MPFHRVLSDIPPSLRSYSARYPLRLDTLSVPGLYLNCSCSAISPLLLRSFSATPPLLLRCFSAAPPLEQRRTGEQDSENQRLRYPADVRQVLRR
ncbi:hypothetical protein [Parapedobacter koreensis]|uniref:hypothetical protein n=1 Tax=Parapedobacter koreensis TaxID=332977 RepID=UPI00115F9907|nr:hypothetical protein [Parapedobacter koreensis]